MSNQEPGSSGIPPEDKDVDENQQSRSNISYSIPQLSELDLWLQSEENDSGFPTREAHDAEHYFEDLNFFSGLELPSPLSSKEAVNTSQSPCTKEILQGQEKGESSGTKRKCVGDFSNTPMEDPKPGGEFRQDKRTRSSETHNQNERLNRQRLNEKMKTLQELIPNCNKKDKASILDDAIKYTKTLQHQLQMMSRGGGFTMFHYPWRMMSMPPQEQILPIPSLPPFHGTGYTLGTGMPGDLGLAMPCPASEIPSELQSSHQINPPLTTSSSSTTVDLAQIFPSFGTSQPNPSTTHE